MAVKPPSVLLCGAAGTGKTYSLATLIEAGLEIFCLFTDPGGEESLIDAIRDKDLSISKAHWAYVAPTSADWDTFMAVTKLTQTMSYSALGEIKSGINKQDYQEFVKVLSLMADFTCERTGKSYGPIDNFGPDRAFVLDSISGIGVMLRHLVVGAKPTLHQGEWGIAMTHQEEFVSRIVSVCQCTTVMTAHMEIQRDEMLGINTLMPSFLGNKLAPKIPRLYSDVILASNEAGAFSWATTSDRAALKSRNLPIASKLEPSFVPVLEKWRARVELSQSDLTEVAATKED